MRIRKRILVLVGIIGTAYVVSLANFDPTASTKRIFWGERDSTYLGFDLDTNDHFMASGNCDGCHGFDETGNASVDLEGNDISPITTWRATMMANSGKDPFFRAKMSHESYINPQHKVQLEDKCTSCHAPLGRFSYHMDGLGPYGLADLETDPFGQDGVSCMACHKQTDEHLGANHSGDLHYDTAMREYGPYEKPFQGPMQGFVGVSPEHGEHVTDAGFCAGCHSLITNTVDLQGDFTGTTFVEQATYHEWLNSNFNAEQNGITCQGCHIPRVEEEVVIAAYYQSLPGRTPYGKHELVGGNTFMLKLMKNHREQLDVRATEAHFDSTIARTFRNLQQKSLTADLHYDGFGYDTAFFSLRLKNLTGHKFPSGYPSRRFYVQFVVTNQHSDTIFKSGILNANHGFDEENSTYEPHYNVIKSEDQVQIYELVMGDVSGNVTTILERAYEPLKDNRLVPQGFTMSYITYDTTKIAGMALSDNDFNFELFEGSGTDVLHFHVPLNGETDSLRVTAKMYYQSVPKKWVEEMFNVSTPQIDTFAVMYNSADHTPVLVAADSLEGIFSPNAMNNIHNETKITAYPNPTDGVVRISGIKANEILEVDVFDIRGKRLMHKMTVQNAEIELPERPGIYLLRVRFNTTEKVLRVMRK